MTLDSLVSKRLQHEPHANLLENDLVNQHEKASNSEKGVLPKRKTKLANVAAKTRFLGQNRENHSRWTWEVRDKIFHAG